MGEFERTYFPHPIYQDEEQDFYKFLGNRKLTSDISFSWNPFTIWSSFKALGARLKEKKIEGNYKGEGFTLGGIIVYTPEDGVVYQYKEESGSEIPAQDIIDAVAKATGTPAPEL